MLLLLFWTVFVCCVLYASRGSKISDTSSDYFKDLPSSKLKRFSNHSASQLHRSPCNVGTPTREDLEVLKRLFRYRRRHSGKPAVHCSVVSLCDSGKQFQADCHSSDCDAYTVRVKDGDHVAPSLSNEELSDIVGTSLGENSFMTVEDLNRYIDVHCQDSAVTKLELTGDIISGPKCETLKTRAGIEGNRNQQMPKKKIHLLYFRFLSHWELPVRFPGLFSLLDKAAKDRRVDVFNFDKHQATKWGDDEALSSLLQGRVGQFQFRDSMLDALRQAGYCFRLEDLSCSKSREQEILVTNVTSSVEVCEGHPLRHREAIMERLCAEGNLTEAKTRSVLTSLLSKVHDLDGVRADPRPLFSLSVLNTKDFKNSEVLDSVLRNFFVRLLQERDRAVVVLSGVGNPAFLRFDQNVRLQSQASNPALMLLSTSNASRASFHHDARRLNGTLFSMRSVHEFLKKFAGSEERRVPGSQGGSLSRSLSGGGRDGDGPSSCGRLGVEPPFTCLCEEQFVEYENDTLMAGFAELAVSVVNAQLRESRSPSPLPAAQRRASPSQCAKLSGVSFTGVRVGRRGDRKRILLDLNLEDEFFKDMVLRRAVLDVWDMDRIPRAEIQFYKQGPSSSSPTHLDLQTDRFLKTLCRTGESLDFHTTSETSLLKRWSQERHFGLRGTVLHVHDNCLFMFVRDFGDSVSVEAANVCRDRRYDVMLHLSLMNMISLSPLPLSVSLGHAQRDFLTAIVKVSYTVPTFAYKLHPDFDVSYDD